MKDNLSKPCELKTTIIIVLTFFNYFCFGQDLVSKTISGLNYHSTTESNQISKTLSHQKNQNDLQLFEFEGYLSDNFEDGISLKLSTEASKRLQDIQSTEISVTIPVSNEAKISLELQRVQIFSSSEAFKDQFGQILDVGIIHTFRGIVKGDHGSIATLTIMEDEVHISMTDRDGTFRVNSNEASKTEYLLYSDKSKQEGNAICGTTEDMIVGPGNIITKGTNTKAAGDIVEIYVECDYQLFLDKGSSAQVSLYVTLLFNEVAALYANENILINVSTVEVWTANDPYRSMSLNNVSAILDEFGSNTQNSYDGRLAALIIGRVPPGDGLGGIAWVDVLCDGYNAAWTSGPYSVNYGFGRFIINTYPNYSLDVSIMAHELGHNFGSPHTHSCTWGPSNNKAIDNCPGFTEGGCGLVTSPTPNSELGTIMSYCNNVDFTKGFGTEPGALVYSRYVNASCLTPNEDPCTHVNRTYSNTTVSSTEVLADNNITLTNTVSLSSSAVVWWQAENQFIVNGIFTVPANAELNIVSENCN